MQGQPNDACTGHSQVKEQKSSQTKKQKRMMRHKWNVSIVALHLQ